MVCARARNIAAGGSTSAVDSKHVTVESRVGARRRGPAHRPAPSHFEIIEQKFFPFEALSAELVEAEMFDQRPISLEW
jgi:hypothetical protein